MSESSGLLLCSLSLCILRLTNHEKMFRRFVNSSLKAVFVVSVLSAYNIRVKGDQRTQDEIKDWKSGNVVFGKSGLTINERIFKLH